jgi:Tfp pilus assembly protein PilP
MATAAAAGAQPPATPPAASQTGAQAPAGAAEQPAASQAYSYDPAGRRDPFVSLLRRGGDQRNAGNRPAGVPGLMIGEVTVKGIIKDRSGFIAMIQGPDAKQTFVVRAGEKLMDGTVKAITADGVIFSQDVKDPLSMVKQKEIRKTVRSADGGRG